MENLIVQVKPLLCRTVSGFSSMGFNEKLRDIEDNEEHDRCGLKSVWQHHLLDS